MSFPLSSTALSPSLDKPSERGWRAAAAPAHRASSCAWPQGGRNATLQHEQDPARVVSAPTKHAGVAWDKGTIGVTLKKPFCLRPATGNPSGFAVEWRADPRGAASPPSPSESSSRVRAGAGGAELSPLRAAPRRAPSARGAGGAVSARGFFTSCRPWPPSPSVRAGGWGLLRAAGGGPGGFTGTFFFFSEHLALEC